VRHPSAPRALGKAQPPSSPARPSAPMDKLLRTADVVEITGHHRCTIYRWVKAGTFPPKRGGGGRGWLRSDVEEWLRAEPWRLTNSRSADACSRVEGPPPCPFPRFAHAGVEKTEWDHKWDHKDSEAENRGLQVPDRIDRSAEI